MSTLQKITISASLALLMGSTVYATEDMKAIEVVSIATKTAKSIDGVAATVEVVTQKEIEQMGAESLKDIIDKTPGINVQYGTFPSASAKSKSSISIRGMSANGTLFLLDGRRVAGEVANPYDLDRIPASIIERIEIVKGPMSSLYGADAVGGVINIITKKSTDEMTIDAGARYGTNEDGDADNVNLNLSIQGRDSAFGYSTYASMTSTDPYTQNETADVWVASPVFTANGPVMGKAKPSSGHLFIDPMTLKDEYPTDVTYREDSTVYTFGTSLSYDFSPDLVAGVDFNYFNEERSGTYVGYFHPSGYKTPSSGVPVNMQNRPIPTYNVPVYSIDENHRLDLSADIAYAANDDLEVKARIYSSSYEKRNSTGAVEYEDMGYTDAKSSEHNGMNADVDILVGELSATYLASESHLVTTGVEYRDEERSSSVFTQASTMSTKEVDYQSVYIQDEWEVNEKFNAVLGVRYDAISNADNEPTIRLGGIYEFHSLAKLRANFAQGYRTPDIRELYIYKQTPNGLQVGADVMGYDLKPESTNAFEIGLGGHDSVISYDLVLFYNQVNDMIAQIMGSYNSLAAYTFENIANANTRGMELSLNYSFSNNLSTNFFWTELKTENEETKRDLEFQPERTVMLSFSYVAVPNLHLGLIGKYIGEQHYTDVINRGAPTQSKNEDAVADSFTTVDITANYHISRTFEVYGGVNNIFSSKVDDVLGSNVGRYCFAGARVSF
ncbi:MAG: TonB-dependent receptor [Campylobacterota bacterium]|nr:TonB-dependent receptor [Campylobacterota bacterium]